MPYYRCPSCGLTSYSAAPSATACATCSADMPAESRLHVVPGSVPDLRRTFLVRPGAAAEARRAISMLPLPGETRETIALIVSELIANSVRHAGLPEESTIDLYVTTDDGRVRVEVRDGGPGFAPPLVTPGGVDAGDRIGGFGFTIVAGLAEAWGVAYDGEGCTVWCTVVISEAGALPGGAVMVAEVAEGEASG